MAILISSDNSLATLEVTLNKSNQTDKCAVIIKMRFANFVEENHARYLTLEFDVDRSVVKHFSDSLEHWTLYPTENHFWTMDSSPFSYTLNESQLYENLGFRFWVDTSDAWKTNMKNEAGIGISITQTKEVLQNFGHELNKRLEKQLNN